jgi:hypothetical protein
MQEPVKGMNVERGERQMRSPVWRVKGVSRKGFQVVT